LIIKEKAMPTVNGQQFPYTPEGIAAAEQAGMGAGRGPDMPPMGGQQMPPIEAVVARIQELQAELQQLVALAEQMGAGQGPPQGMPPGLLG